MISIYIDTDTEPFLYPSFDPTDYERNEAIHMELGKIFSKLSSQAFNDAELPTYITDSDGAVVGSINWTK